MQHAFLRDQTRVLGRFDPNLVREESRQKHERLARLLHFV